MTETWFESIKYTWKSLVNLDLRDCPLWLRLVAGVVSTLLWAIATQFGWIVL